MTDYTKTTWVSGDLITATKANNWETQYDVAKAAFRNGEWSMQADLDMNSFGINNVADLNSGAVLLTDGNIEIADSKAYKIGGLTVISDPVTPAGKFAKDDGTWATPVGSGDVVGPTGATDTAVPIFDDATGKLLRDSLVTIDEADGDIYINSHLAIQDPTGSPTGKFLKDDGSWATPTASATYTSSPDYLVYKDGSLYNAKNMITGAVDYSNSDFSTLIEAVFTAKSDACIFLKSGTYTVASSIDIVSCNGGSLVGAGFECTKLEASVACTNGMIVLVSDSFKLASMTIDGTGKTNCVGISIGKKYGVHTATAMKGVLRDIEIQNCEKAVYFLDQVDYWNFDKVRMMDGNVHCIVSYVNPSETLPYDNGHIYFYGCEMSGTHSCLERDMTSTGSWHRLMFYGCDFHDGHLDNYMINCDGFHQCTFVGCTFEAGDGATNGPGIAMVQLWGYATGCFGCSWSFKNNSSDLTYEAVHGKEASSYGPYGLYNCLFANQLSGHNSCISGSRFVGLDSCTFWSCAGIHYSESDLPNPDVDINFIIDGGGSAITTGVKGYIEIPSPLRITGWTMLGDVSGSIVVDIWKDTYANYPPTVADTIITSSKPTISSSTKGQDTSISSTEWTDTTVDPGDILAFNVDSCTSITRCTVILRCIKTRG